MCETKFRSSSCRHSLTGSLEEIIDTTSSPSDSGMDSMKPAAGTRRSSVSPQTRSGGPSRTPAGEMLREEGSRTDFCPDAGLSGSCETPTQDCQAPAPPCG
ncbi:uncharacterized protein ACO6RY_13003 [Pungitius sinensis]